MSYGDNHHDRTIGDMDHDNTLIIRALVAAGMVWHYVKYAPDDTSLPNAEKQASKLQTELWSDSHKVIAPRDWRKMSKKERDKYG